MKEAKGDVPRLFLKAAQVGLFYAEHNRERFLGEFLPSWVLSDPHLCFLRRPAINEPSFKEVQDSQNASRSWLNGLSERNDRVAESIPFTPKRPLDAVEFGLLRRN